MNRLPMEVADLYPRRRSWLHPTKPPVDRLEACQGALLAIVRCSHLPHWAGIWINALAVGIGPRSLTTPAGNRHCPGSVKTPLGNAGSRHAGQQASAHTLHVHVAAVFTLAC